MFGSGAFHHYDPFFGEDAASLGIDDAGIVGRVPPAPAAALQMTFGQYGGGLDDFATGLPEPFVHHHPGGIDLDDDQAAALVPLDLKYTSSLGGSNPAVPVVPAVAQAAVAMPTPAFQVISAAGALAASVASADTDDDGNSIADSAACSPSRSESDGGSPSSPFLRAAASSARSSAAGAGKRAVAAGHKRKSRSDSGSDSESSDFAVSSMTTPSSSSSSAAGTSSLSSGTTMATMCDTSQTGSKTPEDVANEKHLQRQARNRRSAQQSRERKKLYLQNLEAEVQTLRHQNLELQGRLEDATADNERLRQTMRAAGLPEPLPLSDGGANAKRRRIAAAAAVSASGVGKGGNATGAGLVLFALVFSLGMFISGVPTGTSGGSGPSPTASSVVVPGIVPGRVITPLPALPSPNQQRTSASADFPPIVPVSSTSDGGMAVTEFRRSPLTAATASSAISPYSQHQRRLTAALEAEDTDSDGGDSPDHLHLRHATRTPLRHHHHAGDAASDDEDIDRHADTHFRLTEENLKQLFDLLRSMQGSERLFAATGSDAVAPEHYLFSPNAIRFELPGAESSTPAAPTAAAPESETSQAASDESPAHTESAVGRRLQQRLRADQNFTSSCGSRDEECAGPADGSLLEDAAAVRLKIWVPSLTLKSSLVRQSGQGDVWLPNLEQVDWSDLATPAEAQADGQLVVVPGGGIRPATGQRLFHSGFTEISCTVRGLRDVLLVADKQ